MSSNGLAEAIEAERVALADMFEGLSAVQLGSASLCAGWTVKHVAAHLTTRFNVGVAAIAVRSARHRFDLAKTMNQIANELVQRPIDEIVAQLRSPRRAGTAPRVASFAPLVDLVVHGEDVRRPLGLVRAVPQPSVSASLRFVTGGRALGFVPASRVRNLRFQATDLDGSWGRGPLIHGPAISLLLGIMGRRVALSELGGAVSILDERLTSKVPRIQ